MATLIAGKNRAGVPNGCWSIWFYDAKRKRRQFCPGEMSQADAELWRKRIELLVYGQRTGDPLAPVTKAWLKQLGPTMVKKLEVAGLVTVTDPVELGPFLERYIAQRADTKQSTRTVYSHTQRNLLDYFGADKLLGDITPGDADEWRLYLKTKAREERASKKGTTSKGKKGLSTSTLCRRCGIAKQFFLAAKRKGLIEANPFDDLDSGNKTNDKRMVIVSRSTADRVLAACPDTEWQLIFALPRFGGLRCPTELLKLTWGDIDFKRGRMTVHSPKTEHHEGKATREVPLFPELLPYLEKAFDRAPRAAGQPGPPRTQFVITKYRETNVNLRTQLLRIIKNADVEPWPKLFQNLRSTRETELADVYPLHVVTKWMGNSQLVAAKHYLQVTEEHFQRATGKHDAAEETAVKAEDEVEGSTALAPVLARAVRKGDAFAVDDAQAAQKNSGLRHDAQPAVGGWAIQDSNL